MAGSAFNEPVFKILMRPLAKVILPKPFISVAGDEVVNGISNKGWYDDKGVKEFPGSGQLSGNAEHGGAFGKYFTVLEVHNGRQGMVLPCCQCSPCERALQGCKFEFGGFIVFKDKLHAAVAEVADAVIEDKMVVHWG